jgi:hypothetical protein
MAAELVHAMSIAAPGTPQSTSIQFCACPEAIAYFEDVEGWDN